MNGTQAIESIGKLRGEIRRTHHELELEIDSILEQWEGLKRCGGARDDHAATLLSRLRPIFDDLAGNAADCSDKITALVANPFDRKAVA